MTNTNKIKIVLPITVHLNGKDIKPNTPFLIDKEEGLELMKKHSGVYASKKQPASTNANKTEPETNE